MPARIETPIRIDETADQPGTGDAVDLRPRSSYPDRAALLVSWWQRVDRHGDASRANPGFKSTLQHFRANAFMPQKGCNPVAELATLLADNDCRSGEVAAPGSDVGMATTNRAGNEPRITVKIFVGAHVNDDRRTRGSKNSIQLIGGNLKK
jgi:hypothetical protein